MIAVKAPKYPMYVVVCFRWEGINQVPYVYAAYESVREATEATAYAPRQYGGRWPLVRPATDAERVEWAGRVHRRRYPSIYGGPDIYE